MKQLNDINPNLSKILPRIFFSLIPVLLLSFFLSSELLSNTSAERIDVNIGNGAYYMNINSSDLAVDIDATPEGVTRTVQKDVQISTNSATGYKLYLSMNNNDANGNRLYYNGDEENTSYISPTSSTSLSTNSWGYSTNGSSFSAVPLQGSEAVIASSNSATTGIVSHPVYYGFKVNNSLPFGQYSGIVTYTAVAEAAASPTAKTSVENYLDTSIIDGKTLADPAGGDTLRITTSLMTNMTDLGNITVSVGGTDCPVTGTTVQNKYAEIFCTMPAKSASTTAYTVTATLSKFDKTYNAEVYYNSDLFGTGMKKIRTMQGMTTAVCDNIPKPAAFESDNVTINTNVPRGKLWDTRDTNYYYVKKLADGNCWMDQNLNLDLGTASTTANTQNTTMTLTNADTDLNTKTSWTPPYNTSLNVNLSLADDGSDGAKSFTFRDTDNTGGNHGSGTSGRFWNGSTSYTSTGDPRNHFGNYYNWPAATAESGTASVTSGNVNDSICPKGWKLPASNGEKSFYGIIRETYNISATSGILAEPIHLIYSGFINTKAAGDNFNGQGFAGAFWMSTAYDSTSARRLYYTSNNLSVEYWNEKGYAWAVRCVSR